METQLTPDPEFVKQLEKIWIDFTVALQDALVHNKATVIRIGDGEGGCVVVDVRRELAPATAPTERT